MAGAGIAALSQTFQSTPQLCMAINFDFSTHKCYFFPPKINGAIWTCAYGAAGYLPRIPSKMLVANPFVVTIFICESIALCLTKQFSY